MAYLFFDDLHLFLSIVCSPFSAGARPDDNVEDARALQYNIGIVAHSFNDLAWLVAASLERINLRLRQV